jgi:hypothetical protein
VGFLRDRDASRLRLEWHQTRKPAPRKKHTQNQSPFARPITIALAALPGIERRT